MFEDGSLPTFDAFAKVNLSLHVTGQRSDGYHLLDSVVGFARLSDRLRFEPDSTLRLTIEGPEAEGLSGDDSNLVMQAALALRQRVKRPKLGMAITLEKNLPVASGIGGGSADAAAALVGLNQLWGLHLGANELEKIGVELGADIPMCLRQHALRAQGIGDEISSVDLDNKFIVLANPRIAVSTAAVFGDLATKNNAPIEGPITWESIATSMRNDLETPAVSMVPEIGHCLSLLRKQEGNMFVRMSGSGATCFAIFDNEQDAANAANAVLSIHPNWWVVATRTMT